MYVKSDRWIRALPLTGMLVAIATTALAATAPTVWEPLEGFLTDAGTLLYLAAAVGIVLGGAWSCWRWHQTREFGEGIGGMIVIAIIAVFVFYVIPELISTIPDMPTALLPFVTHALS